MRRCLVTAALVTSALAATGAQAQSSPELAAMGLATWSAFECSTLAAKTKNAKEQERLFLYGYRQGQTFIAAVRAGKIDRKDLSSVVPVFVMLLLEGPTTDFMLGRIYEYAQRNVLKDVLTTEQELNTDDVQTRLAQSKFLKANCGLIGNR